MPNKKEAYDTFNFGHHVVMRSSLALLTIFRRHPWSSLQIDGPLSSISCQVVLDFFMMHDGPDCLCSSFKSLAVV